MSEGKMKTSELAAAVVALVLARCAGPAEAQSALVLALWAIDCTAKKTAEGQRQTLAEVVAECLEELDRAAGRVQ